MSSPITAASLIKGDGFPSWVPRGENGRPAILVRDHANAQFFLGGAIATDVAAFNAAASRTFSRSSSKTRRNAAGTIESVASNVEALDWTTGGNALGLSLDGARTNVLLNSATLSTQAVAVIAQPYTLSFYGTGTITLSGASTAGPLVGTGATSRVRLTFTPTAGSLTLTVSGSVAMANLEAGIAASPWIPTTSGAATRAADLDSHTDGANARPFAGFVHGQGALIWEGDGNLITAGLLALSDGTYNNRIELARNGSVVTAYAATLGVVQANINSGTMAQDVVMRALVAWENNRFEFWLNGVKQGVTDTSFTVPTATTMIVGRNGGALFNMYGHLAKLAYFDVPPWSRTAALSTIGGV